jgi:hypothetical protein
MNTIPLRLAFLIATLDVPERFLEIEYQVRDDLLQLIFLNL